MNCHLYKIFLCILAIFFAPTATYADNDKAAKEAAIMGYTYIRGIVKDSISGESLPYASIVLPNGNSTLTDGKGVFEISVPRTTRTFSVSCLGYNKAVITIKHTSHNMYAVYLKPSTTELQEVVIHKKKYSKKNNPAVDFLNKIKNMSPQTDPKNHKWYSYKKYERVSMAINKFDAQGTHRHIIKYFPFLKNHVDTSEISGNPILNFSVTEKTSDIYYSHDKDKTKEYIEGVRSDGVDEIFDKESMSILYKDIMREIDLYQNDINLMQNRFVSPLSKIAADFYKFYLTDTVEVDNEKCIVLSFYPHNPATFGFIGHVYVPLGDSTMFIKKVDMRIPKGINLNFIDNLQITQTFKKAPDGTRLKTRDDLVAETSIIPGTQSFYARRNVAYDNHSFDAPADTTIFNDLGTEFFDAEAYRRKPEYWDSTRLIEIPHGEAHVDSLMIGLRSNKVYYWSEKILQALFTGYIPTSRTNSKFDYGPLNSTISYSTRDGIRFRMGGMTTANLSKHWFARGFVAFGTRDVKFKYNAELEYSFNEKKYHSREFPMHALRLSHLYGIDKPGQHYLYTSPDNFVMSLKRMSDRRSTYHRVTQLAYILELNNHLSIEATLKNERQVATETVNFIDGLGNNFGHYNENSITMKFRYAPGEKFYQAKSFRFQYNFDAPTIELQHTFAPKGLFGSKFSINKTEISLQKRFWFSAFGYLDVILGGGHVWSKSSYLDLLIPNANLSYIIQPLSYALMNPMEFINTSYASWDVTYWANGALFNYIPYFKKIKLREVVTFRGIYGTFDKKSDPDLHPELFKFPTEVEARKMGSTPYMEISAGIDNILRCLRVDYVWRLSYLNVPYSIDRHGLRIAMHLAF
jgi:hypothetical protein